MGCSAHNRSAGNYAEQRLPPTDARVNGHVANESPDALCEAERLNRAVCFARKWFFVAARSRKQKNRSCIAERENVLGSVLVSAAAACSYKIRAPVGFAVQLYTRGIARKADAGRKSMRSEEIRLHLAT